MATRKNRQSRKQRGGATYWYIQGYIYGYNNPNFRFPRSVQKNSDNQEYHRGQFAGKADRNAGRAAVFTAQSVQQGGTRRQYGGAHRMYKLGYIAGYASPNARFPRSVAINPADPSGHLEYTRGFLAGQQDARNGANQKYKRGDENKNNNNNKKNNKNNNSVNNNNSANGVMQYGGKAWYEFWKSDEPAEDIPQAPPNMVQPMAMVPAPSPNAPAMRRRKN